MRKLILPWHVFGFLWFWLVVLVGAQYGARAVVDAWTLSSESVCSFVGWDRGTYNALELKLNCVGVVGATADYRVLRSYIEHPRPLQCRMYSSGRAFCDVEESEK